MGEQMQADWEACPRGHASQAQHLADCASLPPCEVCGFSTWPAGGMHAARAIHMSGHETKGDLADA